MAHKPKNIAPICVIGIGASAGGLKALKSFFKSFSGLPDSSVIIIEHLDPSGNNLALEVLSKIARNKVIPISRDTLLERGQIYLVPPQQTITFDKGKVTALKTRTKAQKHAMIDASFKAIGETFLQRSVGIILSGEGADGSEGLKVISDKGGLTIAQSPDTSEHSSMPQSAIATGKVDKILSPGNMPEALVTYGKYLLKIGTKSNLSELQKEIGASVSGICDTLFRATGHDFKHYKTSTLIRRILRRMQVLQLTSVDSYVEKLSSESNESDALFNELLINVTNFFRDPEAFDFLKEEILPDALKKSVAGEKFRAWVAGCSTGEEVYSLAIIIRELTISLRLKSPQIQIIATDIDEQALAIARKGIYSQGIEAYVPKELLVKYFVKKGSRYHVTKELREICLFSNHNLINDPPFSQLDLISCRNVLIYLGSHLQKKIIPVFHYALRPGGHLFLGTSESLTSHKELFKLVSSKFRIAQRKATAVRPAATFSTNISSATYASHLKEFSHETGGDLHLICQRIILDEFSPRYAVIDEEGSILSVSAGIQELIAPSEGAFNNSLLKLIRPELRISLRSVFTEAKKLKRKIDLDNCSLKTSTGIHKLGITVQPMPKLGEESSLFMVIFRNLGLLSDKKAKGQRELSSHDIHLIEHLEKELASTREDLDRTVQDLEASNEELKSSNEELLSMNEELQSANEELETSKEDVQNTNEALQRSYADLENLHSSTKIATLFLSSDHRINNFTPAITEIYRLTPSDIGRSLLDFTHTAVRMPPLPENIFHGPVTDEVMLTDGSIYLRRVLPYKNFENRQDGIVVTFVDITELRKTERRASEKEAYLAATIDALAGGFYAVDSDGNTTLCNPSFYKMLGFSDPSEVIGRKLHDVIHHTHPNGLTYRRDDCPIYQAAKSGKTAHVLDEYFFKKDGTPFRVEYWTRPIVQSGKVTGAVTTFFDITQRLADEKALREKTDQLQLALDAGQLGTFSWNFVSGEAQWDDITYQLMGLGNKRPKVSYELYLQLIHPEDRERVSREVQSAIEGQGTFRCEFRTVSGDGSVRWILENGKVFPDGEGKLSHMLGTLQDITSRKLEQIEYERNVDQSPAMLWITDVSGSCTYLSQQWYEVTGQTPETGLGFGWLSAVHPDDMKMAGELFVEANEKQIPFRCEYRLKHKNGNYRWAIDAGNPRLDEAGKYLGIAGSVFDIHDQKLFKAQLEARELEFRTMANSIPQLAWMARADGHIFWYNQRWYDFTGTTFEEMQGWGWQKVHHPETEAEVVKNWSASIAKGETFEMIFPLRSKQGDFRWFLTRAEPIKDESGHVVTWFGTNTDVDDQRKIEAELTANRNQLEAILDSMEEGLVLADHTGKILLFNPRALKLHRFSSTADVISQLTAYPGTFELRTLDDEVIPLEDWPLSKVLRGERVMNLEVRVVRTDLQYSFIASYSGAPVRDDSGKVVLAVLNLSDVTQRVESELKLKEALTARDEFLSIASHELKTPLTSLIIQAQLQERLIGKDDPRAFSKEKIVRLNEMYSRLFGRLNRLIEDMLDISRIRSGKLTLKKERGDLFELIREIFTNFGPEFVAADKPFPKLTGKSVELEFDPLRIEQVLLNFLTNALRYGGTKQVEVKVAQMDKSVCVSVKDFGPGILEEDQKKIFQRFERAVSASDVSGLGLGLFISEQIITAHGGRIWVESKLGQGSEFFFEIPLS